jgi:hypothetical protein
MELVDSAREGRGPKGLSVGPVLFDIRERFVSFMNALKANTYLE